MASRPLSLTQPARLDRLRPHAACSLTGGLLRPRDFTFYSDQPASPVGSGDASPPPPSDSAGGFGALDCSGMSVGKGFCEAYNELSPEERAALHYEAQVRDAGAKRAAVGIATAIASATSVEVTGPAGILGTLAGSDQAAAGIATTITGEWHESALHQGFRQLCAAAGASSRCADLGEFYTLMGLDIWIGMEGVVGAGTRPSRFSAPAGIGSARGSSRALARSLEKAGFVRPAGSAAHHIVAAEAEAAAPARAVLERFGIGINDAENGVFLPKNTTSPNPNGAAVHSSLHTNAYYRTVNQMLGAATSRAEAEAALGAIRTALLSGGL